MYRSFASSENDIEFKGSFLPLHEVNSSLRLDRDPRKKFHSNLIGTFQKVFLTPTLPERTRESILVRALLVNILRPTNSERKMKDVDKKVLKQSKID